MMQCQRSKALGFYSDVHVLTIKGLCFLVFAIGGPLFAAQAMLNKSPTGKPNPRMEPRYDLTPGTRDPFLPSVIIAGTTPEENNADAGKTLDSLGPSESPTPLSQAEVAAGIHLQAVFSKKGDIWGIFNGQNAKEGDTIRCSLRGVSCNLFVVKIEKEPPHSVLRFGETEFPCDLLSTPPNKLK